MIGRVLPVVLIVLSLALFAGYINPTYTKGIVPKQTQIKEYDNTLAAADDFNKKEATLAGEKNAIPVDSIYRLESYLPDGVDNVQLILDLNALAARSGIQLSNFDIKTNTSAAGGNIAQAGITGGAGAAIPLQSGGKAIDSLDLTVKATGSYAAFRTFLSGVEQSLRPMDLVQMTLADSQTGVYTYDITYRIYWLH